MRGHHMDIVGINLQSGTHRAIKRRTHSSNQKRATLHTQFFYIKLQPIPNYQIFRLEKILTRTTTLQIPDRFLR